METAYAVLQRDRIHYIKPCAGLPMSDCCIPAGSCCGPVAPYHRAIKLWLMWFSLSLSVPTLG